MFYPGHFKTISFWDSFHGAGLGAASVGGEEHFSGGLGPMVPGAFHVEFPNYYRANILHTTGSQLPPFSACLWNAFFLNKVSILLQISF